MNIEKQIWDAACRMRGHISATDYRKIITELVFVKQVATDEQWKKIERYTHTDRLTVIVNSVIKDISVKYPNILDTIDENIFESDTLSDVIDVFSTIKTHNSDTFGHIYEYCLNAFAKKEGHNGGEYYTPQPILKLILDILDVKDKNSVYDPCCGSGGVFVVANKHAHIKAYGQEANPDTWKLAKMNMHVHNIDLNIGDKAKDTLKNDNFPGDKFDFVISNPPFNLAPWSRDVKDERWQFGVPPLSNANYAWLQHMFYHLNENGRMGVVLTNSSLTTNDADEKVIRKGFVDNGHVEAIITLPRKLFYSTTLPPCIWFMSKEKTNRTLFIDATKDFDTNKVSECYKRYMNGENINIDKFCSVTSTKEIAEKNYTLFPARYINYTEKHSGNFDVHTIKLGDVAEWRYGRPNADKSGTKYPVYGSSGIIGYTDKAIFKGPAVIVGRKGDIGSIYFEKGDFSASDVVFFTNDIKGEILPDFLYYELKNIDFSVYDEGCGIPSINLETFKELKINIPSIEKQKHKTDMLNSLMKSIEADNEFIKSMEILILDKYNEMFSDYNNFNIKKISDVFDIVAGKTIKTDGDIPWFSIKDMDNIFLTHPSKTVESNAKKLLPTDTVVLSYKLSMGKVSITTKECITNEAIAAFKTDDKMWREYLYCYLKLYPYEELGTTSCIGDAINLTMVRNLDLKAPKMEDLERFHEKTKYMFECIKEAINRIDTKYVTLNEVNK